MPKKVTEIFSNIFSKSRKTSGEVGTLVSDAAPLDNEYESKLNEKKDFEVFELDEEEATTSSTIPTVDRRIRLLSSPLPVGNDSLSHENHNNAGQSLSRSVNNQASEKGCFDVEPYQLPGLDIVRDDRVPTPNSAFPVATVNNTQGYNVYQFSQISGLHIGSVYNITNEAPEKPSSETRPNRTDEPFRRTKTIEAMMKSNERLSHRPMDIIATHLGEGWRDIVRQLGFSDGQIEQMMEDHHIKGVKEVIYQFLLDFSRNEDDATVGQITRLLWKNGRRECVYRLKDEYWKEAMMAHLKISPSPSSSGLSPKLT